MILKSFILFSDRLKLEHELNPLVIERRQKQIDFGKNTIGYELYVKNVPKYVIFIFLYKKKISYYYFYFLGINVPINILKLL
jgi:hypothetical protein